MSTRRQRRANQRNAQHSSGPKSPEGKAASAANATTDGLSSSFVVLPHEDRSAYEQLLQTLAQQFAPTGEHENFLVAQMAESSWRLQRTNRFEAIAYQQLLEKVDAANPDAVIVHKFSQKTANIFDLLQRYRTAAERSYYRAHRELTQARARENRNEANDAQSWIKQQFATTPIPPLTDPIWYAPTPSGNEKERNEPNAAFASAGTATS